MSPHETLFLESTSSCDISNNLSNRLVQFQTWDFGGDLNLQTDVIHYNGDVNNSYPPLSIESIFKNSNTLVYVIDAQEDDYEDALPKLAETISVAHAVNPNINFEVFLHKVDGDFMSDETKAERKQVNTRPYIFSVLFTERDIVMSICRNKISLYKYSLIRMLSVKLCYTL